MIFLRSFTCKAPNLNSTLVCSNFFTACSAWGQGPVRTEIRVEVVSLIVPIKGVSSLATGVQTGHHDRRILLSRINGDAPRAQGF